MEDFRVKQSLHHLLSSHVPVFCLEDIDEVVLSYVMGILDDLVEDSFPDQALDCDDFLEMLAAYLPQSEGIQAETVRSWMLCLVDDIKTEKKKQKISNFDIKSIIEETANKPASVRKARSSSEGSEPEVVKKRCGRFSETSEEAEAELEAGLDTLIEMFPTCCRIEAAHCLTIMAGDLERAAQLVITRAELGEDIKLTQAQILANLTRTKTVDETQVKKKIVDSYGFVDKEEDQRYHRPSLKKGDDKKLIRYRDGKIVSTKGERFSQVTKEESEEMKKTIKI